MQQGIFWGLIGVVCLSPLPLASNRPLPWTILALAVGLLLLAWGVMHLFEPQLAARAARIHERRDAGNDDAARRRRRRQRRSGADAGEGSLAKYTLVFFLGFALLVGWYWLQTSRLSAPLAHPAWAEAASSLGERLTGAISLEPVAGLTLLMKIMSYGGIFIMALYYGRDRHRTRIMFIAISLSSAAYATYGLLEHFGGFKMVLWFSKDEYAGSLTSTFINRNSYATYAGIGILASLGPILQEIRRLTVGKLTALRLIQNMSEEGSAVFFLLLVSVVLNLSALVLTGSRAGFASTGFGLLVFLILILALRDIGLRHFIALLVLAISVVFAFLAIGGTNLMDRLASEGKDARVDLFDVGRLAAAKRPLTGQGLASFSAAFNRANDGAAIYDTAWVDFAHNSYLELAVEGGLIGLIGSLALIGLIAGLMLQGLFTRSRGTSFIIAGLACCALVGSHAIVDFSIQMPAVAATFLFVIGAASGQALPSAQSSGRADRARRKAEEEADAQDEEREVAKHRKHTKRSRRRESEEDEPATPEPVPVHAHAPSPTVAENLRRMAAELEANPARRAKGGSSASKDADGKPKLETAPHAFATDYGSALERWRDLKVTAAGSGGPSTLIAGEPPLEPHPDDGVLVEQSAYIRTGVEEPPPPAFDPSLSQPPMPTAWPGAADSIAPSEPEDIGLPDPEPDPRTPGAKIYELPRNRGNRPRD